MSKHNREQGQVAPADADEWAARITEAWRKTIAGIFETGTSLAEAKRALGHGAFMKMVEERLPFGISVADKLMKIAADKRLNSSPVTNLLPASYSTLHTLTQLNDGQFDQAVRNNSIHPDMTREDAERLVKSSWTPTVVVPVRVTESTMTLQAAVYVADNSHLPSLPRVSVPVPQPHATTPAYEAPTDEFVYRSQCGAVVGQIIALADNLPLPSRHRGADIVAASARRSERFREAVGGLEVLLAELRQALSRNNMRIVPGPRDDLH
jgi:hypothetical protein